MATKWEFEYAAVGLGMPAVEKLSIEDLLDFTNHELLLSSSSSSSAVTDTTSKLLSETQLTASAAAASGGGGGGGGGLESEYNYPCRASFADDIYIPRDEVAELEWLSHFVEDSFSDMPVQSPPSNPAVQTTTSHRPNTPSSCRGARSKRSRVLPTESNSIPRSSPPSTTSSSSSSDFTALTDGATRRCTHCASEKTPQWRTGPFGPKTLCNACGVRYKSGRLVPEYRPAASPTFLLTQHSNSHRKVLELRRQKELHVRYNDNGAPSATGKMTEMLLRDYDVC